MELDKSATATLQQQPSPMEKSAQQQQQSNSNPLFMLEKACEGIGCYTDSSPNKKSSISKANGHPKFPGQSHQQRPSGATNGGFDSINGTPKSTSNKKDSRKSPRSNGLHNTNALLNGYCEPSTSSPSNATSLNLPGTFPPGIAANGAFPFHMMGCFPPGAFPAQSSQQMPNNPQQRQQQQHPQFPHGMINGGPLQAGPFGPPNAVAAAAALFPGAFANGQHPFLPPMPQMMPPSSMANGLTPGQIQMMVAMQQQQQHQHQQLAAAAAAAHMFPQSAMPQMPNPVGAGPVMSSAQNAFLQNNAATNASGKKQSQQNANDQQSAELAAAFAHQQILAQLAAGGAPLNPFMINALNPTGAFPGALLSDAATNAAAAAMLNGSNNGGANLTGASGSSNIHNMLMAAACGQNKMICTYEVKGGQVCGKVFTTESEIWSHFKSSHISQITSPTVTSTTNGHAIGTTTAPETTVALASTLNTSSAGPTSSVAGGGKMKSASLKGSPTSACTTPAATKPKSNPGAMYANGAVWTNVPGGHPPPQQQHTSPPNSMVNAFSPQQQHQNQQNGAQQNNGPASSNRFHPYASKPTPQQQQQQNAQQQQQHNAAMFQQQQMVMMHHLFQMATASAAVSSASSTGPGQHNLTQTAPGMLPPHQMSQALQFEIAAAAAAAAGLPLHQQFLGGPPVSMPNSQHGPSQQQQQSQLAALAAMTNGVGNNGGAAPPTSAAPGAITTAVTAAAT